VHGGYYFRKRDILLSLFVSQLSLVVGGYCTVSRLALFAVMVTGLDSYQNRSILVGFQICASKDNRKQGDNDLEY
jgi:hypothetical protein